MVHAQQVSNQIYLRILNMILWYKQFYLVKQNSKYFIVLNNHDHLTRLRLDDTFLNFR